MDFKRRLAKHCWAGRQPCPNIFSPFSQSVKTQTTRKQRRKPHLNEKRKEKQRTYFTHSNVVVALAPALLDEGLDARIARSNVAQRVEIHGDVGFGRQVQLLEQVLQDLVLACLLVLLEGPLLAGRASAAALGGVGDDSGGPAAEEAADLCLVGWIASCNVISCM